MRARHRCCRLTGVRGHHTCGRCWRRARAVAGLLPPVNSRARVPPRRAFGLVLSDPDRLRPSHECCRLGHAGQAAITTVVAWPTWRPPNHIIHLPAQTSLPLLSHRAAAHVAALPMRRAASAPQDRCPASHHWRALLGVMPPNSSTLRQPPHPVNCAHGAMVPLIDRCHLILTHLGSVV